MADITDKDLCLNDADTKRVNEILRKIGKGANWKAFFDWHSSVGIKGIYVVSIGKKVTHYDSINNRFVSGYWFDDAHNFGYKDYAIVKCKGKFNVIKKNGEFVFTEWKVYIDYHRYWNDDTENFFVFDGGKEYLTNTNGEIIRTY